MNNWEKGKVLIGIPELTILSNVLNVPADYIFCQINLLKVDK